MDVYGLVFALCAGIIGAGFGGVSLVLHWVRRNEHPDVAQVRADVTHIRTEIADILDRFEHWQKRQRVRNLRAGREAAAEQNDSGIPAAATSPADIKRALRAKVYGVKGAQ